MPLSVSLWNDLNDPVVNDVGLAGLKSRANEFLLAYSAVSFCQLLFDFFSFLPRVGCVGLRSSC